MGVSALGASVAHAAAWSGGGRGEEASAAMEAKPADLLLCDSLILWVSGAAPEAPPEGGSLRSGFPRPRGALGGRDPPARMGGPGSCKSGPGGERGER